MGEQKYSVLLHKACPSAATVQPAPLAPRTGLGPIVGMAAANALPSGGAGLRPALEAQGASKKVLARWWRPVSVVGRAHTSPRHVRLRATQR